MAYPHKSVLLHETLELFKDKPLKVFIDATLGAGGHSEALFQAHPEMEKLIGIDQDVEAISIAKERLKEAPLKIIYSNFATAPLEKADGILADIGVSSMQLDRPEKGFSFRFEGPLDMRMDANNPLTAAQIVNEWEERELARLFREYGEEKRFRDAARAIIKNRPFHTTKELHACLEKALYNPKLKIDPATRVFQALRIQVNDELNVLKAFIPKAIAALNPGGILAIITFHSLEDRIVKHMFRDYASDKVSTSGIGGMFLEKKPEVRLLNRGIVANDEEIRLNPRSRSATLRAVEKLETP